MTIRLALLGAGRIGLVHAQAIQSIKTAELAAVYDISQEAADNLIAAYGGQSGDINTIANSEDIDAVLICTPTNTHADLIEKFARAGKAIFCEKPIDLNIGRVRDCLKIVEQTSAKLMLGFNRRFDPHFIALKETIRAGQIGEIEMINIISRDPEAPPAEYIKVSGGIFKDMTIHDFDMARFLLGEEIETVMASASVLVDPAIGNLGDFDSANVILKTASGKQCVISNSRRASYGYDQRIEVHGSLGMVQALNQRPIGLEVATANGFLLPPLHNFFMTRYTQAYAEEISVFVHNLRENQPASPNGNDGLMALALAEAALLSLTSQRAVKLAEIL